MGRPAARKPPAVRVEVLCMGTELLSGKVNTHVSWLAGVLKGIGLAIAREATLRDRVEDASREIRESLARSDVVLVCGGLGPTFDDVTREAAARALGTSLRFSPGLYAKIRAKFSRYYKRVPARNKRQAHVLGGARVLSNGNGSAPGQILRRGKRAVILLPGPPRELQPMFLSSVVPFLKAEYARGACARATAFHMAGLTESQADAKLEPLVSRPKEGLDYTILASTGLVDFHVAASGENPRAAERLLSRARGEVLRRVGRYVFGTDSDTLESVVGRALRARELTLATAESCTGGLISERLTSVPGSSDYYAGGVVAYSNAVKRRELGVKKSTLAGPGAVSAACAKEMADGALKRLRARVALSVTGIAGPGGASRGKPVGLTYIGLAREGRRTVVRRHLFAGDRNQVRRRAAIAAMTLLLRSIGGLSAGGRG